MTSFNPQPSRRFTQDRVQTLVDSSSDTELNKDVKVEGLFIQLNEDGLPMRQVFLAFTKEDFIIVKQETNTEILGLVERSDDVISDLSLDTIIPIPLLHFFIIDDRAKRFTVCTSHGILYHFEMCLLDFCAEQDWARWGCVIARLTEKRDESFGAKSNKISYVVKVDEKIHQQFEATRKKYGLPRTDSLHFIHNPMTFKQVESVGIQTKKGKAQTKHNHLQDVKNNKEIHEVYGSTPIMLCSSSESSANESVSVSVSSEDMSSVCTSQKYGDTLLDRLKYLYTGNEFWRESASRDKPRLKRWSSLDNLIMLTSKNNGRSMSKQKNMKKSKQFQSRMNQINKLNDMRMGKSPLKCNENDDDDDDNDVDKAFQEIEQTLVKKNKTKRDGLMLWSLARRLILKEDNNMPIIRELYHVNKDSPGFRKLTSLLPLPASIIDFTPSDVSSYLTYMSRKLFLLITTQDIEIMTSSNGRQIPKSISDILKYIDVIVKMVVTETLKANDGISGQIRSLKFFVQVSLKLLFRHHDFLSLTSILKGLVSLPLYHMDNLWANLFVQEPIVFCQFMAMIKFLCPIKRYQAYTSRVETLTKHNTPFIPWIDHILHHCHHRSTEDVHSLTANTQQTFGEVIHKVKLFENIAKSFKFSKSKTANKDENPTNSKLTSSIKNKNSTRGKKKLQRKVTFNVKDKDNNESPKSAEMKHRGKALWVKRIVSLDEMKPNTGGNKADNAAEVQQADQQVDNYSHTMSQSILASALNDITADRDNISDDHGSYHLKDNGNLEQYEEDSKHEASQHNSGNRKSDLARSNKNDITKGRGPKNKAKLGFFERLFSKRKKKKSTNDQLQIENEFTKPDVITVSIEETNISEENEDKESDDDNNKINTDDKSKKSQIPQEMRKMSYIPSAVTNERRKSLFEEALETHDTEEDEGKAFEALLASRKSENDVRKSGIDLLTIGIDTDYPVKKDKSSKKSFAHAVSQLFGRHADHNDSASCEVMMNGPTFGNSDHTRYETFSKQLTHNQNMNSLISKQKSNTSNAYYKAIVPGGSKYTDIVSYNSRGNEAGVSNLTQSLSRDRLDYERSHRSIKHCGLCCNKLCIYGDRISTQVMNYQIQLLDMKTSSHCTVKEYFQLVTDVCDCRSDIDVLQLSLL